MRPGYSPLSRLLSSTRPGDAAVCRDGERLLDWRDLVLASGGIARTLIDRPGGRWIVHCDHPFQFAAAVLALLHTGRRAVIPPGFEPGVIAQLRQECDGVVGTGPSATVDVSRTPRAEHAFEPLTPRTAVIDFYTSGSSAAPKRVEKSLAQLDLEAQTLESCWGALLGSCAVVATVPHHHIYGMLFRLIWPLAAGRVFDAALCLEPTLLMERIALNGRVALVSGPAHLTRLPALVDLARIAPSVQVVFSSGAPLPGAAAHALTRALGASPIEVYGSTETGGIGWRRQDGTDAATAWTPFPGITVAADPAGALRLRSPYLVHSDWTQLDDGGEMLADGRFRLAGRLDRVAKIEGKRVSLPEIEQRLREHPWIEDAAVIVLGGRRETLGAAVLLRDEARTILETRGRAHAVAVLRRYLRAYFEPVALPRRWRFPEAFPLTDRGKISVAELGKLLQAARDDAPVA